MTTQQIYYAEELRDLRAKFDMLGAEFKSIKQQVGKDAAKIKRLEFESEGVVSDENLGSRESWRMIGSGEFMELSDEEENIFELPQDVYSFLATSTLGSVPFWLAVIVVFGFQYTLLFLLLGTQTDFNKSQNPLDLPENVEISVRITQALLLVIAMFQQDDLLVAIETLNRGVPTLFRGKETFQNMSSWRWTISCLIRMSTGLLGLLAAFVLSIQSDNVLDVVLNVLGVEFVSNLDNLAFELGSKGYFGRFIKRATEDVCEATFHRRKDNTWIRRVMHIIIALTLLIGVLSGLSFIFYRQDANFLSVREIHVEFDDDIVPFLGLFNGCYTATENRQLRELGDRRLFYAQDGFPLGGKFGYCSNFGNGESGWTFFLGDFRNPCESYIVRSEDTVTFSVLEAGRSLEWFTAGEDWESIGFIDLDKMTDRTTDCGHAYFESSLDVCPTIQALRSLSLKKLIGSNIESTDSANRINQIKQRGVLDAAVSHTIYYGESDDTAGVYDLVFFTGRRWVWTTTDEIVGLQNASSLSEISDYFYGSAESTSSGLFRLLEDLLLSGGNQWVRFISEAVYAGSESPLGLQWYYPLYKNLDEITETETEDKMDYSNVMKKLAFPSPDTIRKLESESTLACQFCDLSKNPCFFGGVCNERTGVCSCRNGASGGLCQERPLGNGICNLFFNTAEHNYDGGDVRHLSLLHNCSTIIWFLTSVLILLHQCCASTCSGPFCGQDDLLNPYITGAPTFNWLDESDTEGMFEITNKDDVWMKKVESTTIAFGVNVTANLTYQFPPLRYEYCIDPALAVIRIEVLPSEREWTTGALVFDGMTIQCEGTTHLKTPIFRVSNYTSPVFSEEIRVPFGAQCAIGFQGPGYFRGVSLLAEDNSIPFVQLERSCSVDVYIPQSSCVWEAFAGASISVATVGDLDCELPDEENDSRRISVPEFDALGSDPVLDGFCRLDPFQLLERYYVWDILSKGSGKLVRASVGHVCDGGWNTGIFSMSCNQARRVRRLSLNAGSSKSFVDSMTSNVKHFAQLGEWCICLLCLGMG